MNLLAGLPQCTDAVEGSAYGFHHGFIPPAAAGWCNFPPPYSAGSAAAPGSGHRLAVNAGIGGTRMPGATQLSDLNEDAANEASEDGEEYKEDGDEEGASEESGPEDGGENAGNKAGFTTTSGDNPRGEHQAIFCAQWLTACQIPQLMSNRQMRMRDKPSSCFCTSHLQQLHKMVGFSPPADSPLICTEGRDVLDDHCQRNRAVRPPRQSQLQDNCTSNQDADASGGSDGEEESQETPGRAEPAKLSWKSTSNEAHHMQFYNGIPGWIPILESVKNWFRLHVCTNTVTPFPTVEHNAAAMTGCIAEAMAEFQEEHGTVQLNAGIYSFEIGNSCSQLKLLHRCIQPLPSPNGITRKIRFSCTIRLLKQQVPAIQ